MKQSQKKLNESYSKKNIKDLLKYYDKWESYEQDLMSLGFFGPVACTALLFKYVRPSAKILEVGIGPGNLGNHLRLFHFNNIYGLDGSTGMIKRAKKRNIYKKIYHHVVGKDKLPCKNIDALVASGVFTVGHFPQGAMKICFDAVKSKGFFCFSGSDKVLNSIFKQEFDYVRKNSKLIASTSSQPIVAHADKSHQYPAKGYLFQKK